MNLHPHRELRSRRTNRPRPPHLRQPGFFIPALSCPVHTSLFSHLIPPLFPQRQHFPRFSAIAAWPFSLFPCYRPSGRHCHPVTLPQRQHFSRFSAVVALPFSPAFRCRCGITFLAAPLIQTPWATFYFRHISTTAAISAFRCRCGIALLAAPLLQAFRTALPSCSSSTTAPFPAFRCRCGMAFFTSRFSAVVALTFSPTPATGLPDGIAILLRFGR